MTAWLLTWLWQGSVLAAAVAITLGLATRLNAATRHVTWCAALTALAWLGWASSPARRVLPLAASSPEPMYIPSAPDLFISVIVGMWAAITLVRLLRVLPGLRAVYTARDCCRPFPSAVVARLPLWREVNGSGRPTELMICDAVPGATVLGFLRPCIAIPSALIEALTCEELDQVILHEHAHVQRRDDWSRLTQTLLLSALWVHPAVVFVSRALSREREMACDEWVVARTGSPKRYARCLARAAEVRMLMQHRPTFEPALIGSRPDLVLRVERILAINDRASRGVSMLGASAAACAIGMLSLPLQGMRFSEMADVMFPHVTAPVLSVHHGATAPLRESVLLSQPGAVGIQRGRSTVRPMPDNTHQASDPPGAPSRPITFVAVEVPSRTFAVVYSSSNSPAAPPAPLSRWNALAAPGVEIASAAKETGLRVANGFSRAGASLARRF